MRSLSLIEMDLRVVLSAQPLARVAGGHELRQYLDEREALLLDELLEAGLTLGEAGALYDRCVVDNRARMVAPGA